MSLLGAATYDPAAAVSKVTTGLLAMTALDTTNLRVTFTAPANGIVLCRLRGGVTGATTSPRILLGVLDGATVRLRMSPMGIIVGSQLATTEFAEEIVGVVTGLTPGQSYTWDAAYGVEIVLAATAIKYGGPNDASGADAYGAFLFEVWSTENLLAGKVYDPAVQATIVGTALKAMTVIDSTNLRLTFTAPPSGNVLWRIHTQIHGSGTTAQMLLGILDGATVRARVAPIIGSAGVTPFGATATEALEASGVITGLTPGQSYTWDAAFAVQVVTSAQGIRHGGPDDTTTNNATGGTAFEIWAA